MLPANEGSAFNCIHFGVPGGHGILSFFPQNTHISFSRADGGRLTFSRTGISFEKGPDRYTTNGFSHIEPYVRRLVVPTNEFKFLSFFTPDGNRGFGLSAKDGVITADLTIECLTEPEREAAIRAFFASLGVAPSRDYLAADGGVSNSTRFLDFPITGTASEVTALTKRVLQELCSISSAEALDISYDE